LEEVFTDRLDEGDPYLQTIHEKWGRAILEAFNQISEQPDWEY
jgi:predicted proteasome-type protease